MEQNDFWINLIATLEKAQSKKQIQSDVKDLGEIKIPLVGTLSKSKTKAQLKQDLASLNGTINLTGKVNQEGIVTSVQQATKQAQATADKKSIQVSMNLKKDKLINDIKILGQQNTKMFKDANMSAKYSSLLDNAKLATSNKEIADLRFQLSAMRSEIKATNLSGLTLGDTLKKAFKRVTELFTGTGGVMLLIQQMRQAWTEALNLDKAYTDLIKVQDELSRGDYPAYLEQCNRKAQELASTQKALIEGATEFSKSGYTKTVSDGLSEKSTVLANVGDMSASDSAKAIISGVQAYDIVDGYDDVIDKAGALIDKYNEIGNTASITTAEIAEGVQAVGSVFTDANTSVDEFIALLAAGNRQYQDADALALGLRTAALRIRGCTAELEMMNEETEGVYTSASKLADKIEGLTNIDGNGGVKILETDGETFRSIYDIFLDISKVYNDMSDTDQSALLELIAGKHRSSAISATLNNMSEAQEIYQRSLEASGSAQREYDKYLSSSEAALNRFQASMTETYQSVINGQTVTGLLNCGNATLQLVNNLGLVESTLKGLVAIGIVKAITTLSTAFKASAIQASNFGTALNTIKSMSNIAKDTTKYADALNTLKTVSVGLSEAQLKQVLASKALGETERIAILRTTGLSKAQAKAKLAQMGLTESTKAQTTANTSAITSTFSLTAAVKGFGASLKAAFMSNPVGIAIMALSTAIGLVTSAIDSANQKAEEARQKAKDAAETANTLSTEISDLTGKYLTLSEAVQTDKSSKEELMSIQEELIKKLGIEGEGIDSLISKYGSLDEAIKQVTLEELGDMENDLIAGVKAAEDELREVGKGYEHFYSFTNRNLLSSGGKDAVKAYQVLNEAEIIGEGSYGTGGGSVVLTGDDSTVEGILENYQKLQDAIQALRESDEFTQDELKNNPVFLQIYNRAQEMEEFVDGYNDSITALNQNVAQQQILNSLKGMELPDTEEEFNRFRDDLIKTAQSSNEFIGSQEDIENAINSCLATVPQFVDYYGELSNVVENTTDALIEQKKVAVETDLSSYLSNNKELEQSLIQLSKTGKLDTKAIESLEEYDDMLKLCGNDADTLVNKLNEIANQSSNSLNAANTLDTITGGLDSLAKVYDQAMNDNFVQSDAITTLYEQFGDLSVFDGFVTSMQNIGNEAYNTADAFNKLADAYINTNLPLDNLTEATKQQYIEELKGNGVTNAKTAIQERLAYVEGIRKQALASLVSAQQYANLTTQDLANATIGEINSMIDAANAAGMDSSALKQLAIMKAKVSANQINESTSISEILSVAKACGIATPQLSMYNTMKNSPGVPSSVLDSIANNAKQSVLSAINNFDFGFEKYQYSGGGKYSSSGSGSGSSSASEAKETEKQYDWIAVAIKRVQEAIARLTKVRDNSYTGWSKRNTALNSEISEITKEISLQQQAYDGYMANANAVGLSQDYIKKIQNGTIAIEDITDEGLQEQIDAYQEWYEKAIECSDAIQDLNIKLSELAEQKFDNVETEAESFISLVQSQADIIDERVKRAEEQGYFLDKNYYESLIGYKEKELESLRNEYDKLNSSLNDSVAYGLIKEGSENWSDMKDKILDVEKAIEESTTALVGFNNELRDLKWDIFDYVEERISKITDESEFLIDLLDNDSSLYNDNGSFNSRGISASALHGINFNTYMQQSIDYVNELRKIESDLANDKNNQDLIARREELLKLQREAIKNAESEKDAIRSLVEEGINIHLDALSSLIEKYKQNLNAAKDLYDYQKNITKQTDNIANLEKVLVAYNGDDSEEARKIIQSTKVSLEEAKQDLKETEWDRYLSDTEDLLDSLYDEYEDVLNGRLDNIDSLISDTITESNQNKDEIASTLKFVSEKYGYQITNTMDSMFTNNGNLISNFMNVFSDSSTTLQNSIDTIKNYVANMAVAGNTNIATDVSVSDTADTNGWVQNSNGTWQYYQDGVRTFNGWIKDNNKWYHMNKNGDMDTDTWIHNDSGSWSYVGSGGDALTGWQQLGWNGSNDWYFFDDEGTMRENTWMGDYFLGSGGQMKKSTWVGHNGKYYWVGADGKWLNLPGWTSNAKPKDGLPIYEYAKGSKYIDKDQMAWTQEQGAELVYHAEDGSLLIPLGKGDMVFTNEMTKKLWELSKSNIPVPRIHENMFYDNYIPKKNNTNVNSTINVTVEANDPDEFAKKLGNKLMNNQNFIDGLQEVTLGQALGHNNLGVNKFRT